jgi:hypothetical protein
MKLRGDDEPMQVYGSEGVIFGGRVDNPYPRDTLGYLQPHEFVTVSPLILSRARELGFAERKPDEFEIFDTGAKLVFRDRETGEELVREESAILVDPSPSAKRLGIVAFCVTADGRMHLLRPRGVPREPDSSMQLSDYVVAGPVSKLNVRPAKTAMWPR